MISSSLKLHKGEKYKVIFINGIELIDKNTKYSVHR